MFEPSAEDNAKALLKEIFDFLEGIEKYLRRMKGVSPDNKERDIGGKYSFAQAHDQTKNFINTLKRELMGITQPPNAA